MLERENTIYELKNNKIQEINNFKIPISFINIILVVLFVHYRIIIIQNYILFNSIYLLLLETF